jgi:hypothetical protein
LKEIYTALIQAQSEFRIAIKDVKNPFFKSLYADLESIVNAVQPALTKNGLGFIQPISLVDGLMVITTTIIHTSGQSISSIYPIDPVKKDPQGYGSAITYARRYALSAMLGVVTGDDDDGNAASSNAKPVSQPVPVDKVIVNNAPITVTPLTHDKYVFKNGKFMGKKFSEIEPDILDAYMAQCGFNAINKPQNEAMKQLFELYEINKKARS